MHNCCGRRAGRSNAANVEADQRRIRRLVVASEVGFAGALLVTGTWSECHRQHSNGSFSLTRVALRASSRATYSVIFEISMFIYSGIPQPRT